MAALKEMVKEDHLVTYMEIKTRLKFVAAAVQNIIHDHLIHYFTKQISTNIKACKLLQILRSYRGGVVVKIGML